jgi:hypothetical protein
MAAQYNNTTKVIIYTITVLSDGPANAANVVTNDARLRGANSMTRTTTTTLAMCGGAKTVKCSQGTLTSGSSATTPLTVKRTDLTKAITNKATVTASVFDIDKSDNSATTTVRWYAWSRTDGVVCATLVQPTLSKKET